MTLGVREGDRFDVKGKTYTVSTTAMACLPRVRIYLIGLARAGETTTYLDLKRDLDLPYAVNGLGWLLDVVTEDCRRRGEPSLASLVVTAGTGEVGADYPGEAAVERSKVYAWSIWEH
ncbi:hypothetical protein [Phycicoccus flavus]|uniref:hypothetical protein n=1 Tax=Phycicoccus flavus TaxID=2502783 RepID=UPI000FEB9CE7|nr:hypothetical protein [Phycicoccus flavus]NHA70114.1 hypothetical protein [Phycicoccus flavus]